MLSILLSYVQLGFLIGPPSFDHRLTISLASSALSEPSSYRLIAY